ncbi:COX15/CtaA family protein [Coralloluteibacterium stylophorae]|uniref:COX15/CtaA family protein n=1 Tax=Coralloluteibacterium stylophorae TaxID=1776034 RepID=A0A8J7VS00_9GAMM|nr:COX15/CtaA family protein [Coralloluteibacterium stylophorae]MBS7458059.1 COX15/CtaA family protein [Coralloluteibacterium stylophorae]
MYKHFHRLAWLAFALATVVIVFGAFVRLSDAGLSCPDWPTCYGRAAWPTQADPAAHLEEAGRAFARPVETHKAWREQLHRHLAATLGLGVLALALLAARRRRFGMAAVVGASVLVAAAIPLYMQGAHVAASLLAGLGELILVVAALRWSNADLSRVAALTLAVIVFQALLGMWTVTWLLKPIVVMGHLLGGLATFSLLAFMAWRATAGSMLVQADAPKLRRLLAIGLGLLVLQIALGGWTSANYAALACGTDFPTCAGQWWPQADWREAFVLWRGIGVDYEGGVLDGDARVAIQMAHRLVALLVFGHLLMVAVRLWRTPGLRPWGTALAVLLVAQVALGISNVHFGLPLAVAVAHNAGAAALLFVVVSLLTRLRTPQ